MTSAISLLKQADLTTSRQRHDLSQLLSNTFADKGFTSVIKSLFQHEKHQDVIVSLVGHFFMRQPYEFSSSQVRIGLAGSIYAQPLLTYSGTDEENLQIDHSIADNRDRVGYRDRIGRGAARYFSLQGFKLPPSSRLKQTPVVIIGAGAAGILIARTLVNAGYTRMRILDASGKAAGIWKQKNVAGLSKNNPFAFVYEQFRVEAAPGPGEHIANFLMSLTHPPRWAGLKPLPTIEKATVLSVEPGDLSHRVRYRDTAGEHEVVAPIVINALGIGKPLPPSRKGKMTTDVPAHEAGIRWQQLITSDQAEKLQGKTLVFIGLGNSTAEMIAQLQRYQRAGIDVRYKVLTHYPKQALLYPDEEREVDGKTYELFRDIDIPQLTKLAGDLDTISEVYNHVLHSEDESKEELIGDVTHWTILTDAKQKTLTITFNDGNKTSFPFDDLYTLIGYGHTREVLEAMGMHVLDEETGTIAYDYDGEIQCQRGGHGRARIYPGYYALGSLLKTPHNPNALVIPGMLFRLPDQFASIVLRSAEFWMAQRASR